MTFELPELDEKATKQAVESIFRRYRVAKYLSHEEREVSITTNPDERLHGPTFETSDQVAEVATYNADQEEKRRKFCEKMERAVKHLPPMEKFLIESRYMGSDSEYLTDYNVYSFKFQPPISAMTYINIRWKAFYKLALNLNVAVIKKANEPSREQNID